MLAGRFQGGTAAMSWPSIRIRPAVGRLEAGQHAQERGLAAAGRAQQGEELALVDVEADIVDGVDVAELLGDVLDLDERLGVRVLPGLDPVALVGARPGRGGGRPVAVVGCVLIAPPAAGSAAGDELGPEPRHRALRALVVRASPMNRFCLHLGRREQVRVATSPPRSISGSEAGTALG